MAKGGGKSHRSAVSGRYVTKSYASKAPNRTVAEDSWRRLDTRNLPECSVRKVREGELWHGAPEIDDQG